MSYLYQSHGRGVHQSSTNQKTKVRKANVLDYLPRAWTGAYLAFQGGVLARPLVGSNRFPSDNHRTTGLERDFWEPSLDTLCSQLSGRGRQVFPIIDLPQAICCVQVRQERGDCSKGWWEGPRVGFFGWGFTHGNDAICGDL